MNSETLKNKLKPIVYPIINFIPRRRLKNKNFTIICDNCWAQEFKTLFEWKYPLEIC